MKEKLYKIALTLLPGVGSTLFKTLILYKGTAENVFKAAPGKLIKIPGIGPLTAELLKKAPLLREAEKILADAEKENVKIIFFDDSEFPKRLREIYDGPAVLYVKGNADLNADRTVGIVGTRNATEYGKKVTSKITEELTTHIPSIVSGLAYGIDIAAHKAALDCRLPTIAVLASGVDIIYPAAHKQIAEKITENGALISEYPFGEKPDPRKFPARNRIIAGLSDALVVVEAAAQGGALITAEIADSYNKPVFAVPGNLTNHYSEGCNNLIKQHKASIFTACIDLAEALLWSYSEHPTDAFFNEEVIFENIGEEEQKILRMLAQTEGMEADLLSYKTGVSLNRMASVLLELELRGFVKLLPGNRYSLTGRSSKPHSVSSK